MQVHIFGVNLPNVSCGASGSDSFFIYIFLTQSSQSLGPDFREAQDRCQVFKPSYPFYLFRTCYCKPTACSERFFRVIWCPNSKTAAFQVSSCLCELLCFSNNLCRTLRHSSPTIKHRKWVKIWHFYTSFEPFGKGQGGKGADHRGI